MRRLTKAQPIGGASLCSLVSSAAYSGGSASGMVAISWATFMIGPFQAAERRGELGRVPGAVEPQAEHASAAIRAATPPTLAPTRA